MHLSEKERIEVLMMIGFGDWARIISTVRYLLSEKLNRNLLDEHGHDRDLPKERPAKVSEDSKLDVLLETHNNPHLVVRTISRNCNLSSGSVSQILREAKYHP